MAENCIFCKIINKEIPAKIEHDDDLCLAFHDINPQAKVHLLIIPKKHIPTLKDMDDASEPSMGRMFTVARDMAKKFQLENYRLKMSVGKEAGQEVFHIHLHLTSAPA